MNDLKKFKVLGTIDNVILVLDKSTEETFVIKVSRHSGLQIYGGPGSLSRDFKIWPITFQGSGSSGPNLFRISL